MPASPIDSALYRQLFRDEDTAQLFTDSAEVRAMMLVEGALARAQGALGVIPETAAAYLYRASFELQIDPVGLSAETAVNGVPVPALVAAFRKAAEAPEHTAWLHWGATSQDIMDTALALRLKRVAALWDERLGALLIRLADLADAHAELAMTGRTYGQAATPTSFGAVVAGWGRPILRHRQRLAGLLPDILQVSLSGAAGTLSAMGPQGPAVRAELAKALGLTDPGASWHAERDSLAVFAAWMAGVTGSLAKIGEDLILLTQSGIAEVAISGAGGSSTMPQKQNPVGPSVLVALARQAAALSGVMQVAIVHRQQRDGAAWFAEWLSLPQLCLLTGRSQSLAQDILARLQPEPDAMAQGLAAGQGLIFAEALSFALTKTMPRPEAQAAVKQLCVKALSTGQDLIALARQASPDQNWSSQLCRDMLGQAPAEARAFAHSVRHP
ncbi:MAG: adenylosuccinate lyase family protein [Rhodobacteraceae bacterium]|nr:adenylosuccinate lyase family protein [Paracoccaceae bacterium]